MGQGTEEPVRGYHSGINSSKLLGTSSWGSQELSSSVPFLHTGSGRDTEGNSRGMYGALGRVLSNHDDAVKVVKAVRWTSALSFEKGGKCELKRKQ